MSDKKQTAVSWIEQQLKDILEKNNIIMEDSIWNHAQQMKREQMKLIYDGLLQNVGTSIKESDLPTFEQYYNETYGGHSVDANEMIDHNGDVNEMVGGQDEK